MPSPAAQQTGAVGALAPSGPASPQLEDRALDFLSPYGLGNFQPLMVLALQTFLEAQELYELGRFTDAKVLLDDLWAQHPSGTQAWGNLPTQPFGINVGSPPCYYGLRMLSDMVDWRVSGTTPGSGLEPRTVRLTVLLVEQTSGIEPRNQQELVLGTGIPVTHQLDPRITRNGARRVHDPLQLFREYIFCVTQGLVRVETEVLPLPAANLAVEARAFPPYAGLSNASDVWEFVPEEVERETDWWWLLYPSHVPEQYPDFVNREFITGGMGTGNSAPSPLFIIDDRWLLRKPPHLGTGDYTEVERDAYLPQWLQHEFFHHLFRTYPEFGLETLPHQWFNLNNWPTDFEGRFEADYFHEALTKRLQSATPALHAGLRYATADAPYDQLDIANVLGTYWRLPVQNAWHMGDVGQRGLLRWQNTAGVSWNLQEDLANGALLTGPDCPYFNSPGGKRFQIIFHRDQNGDFTTELRGFSFNGELYSRQ
ncbi:MAG: hypothetical protein AAGG01_22530 [Planctomycetota bacterium]